jgi:pectate lyase-like protein
MRGLRMRRRRTPAVLTALGLLLGLAGSAAGEESNDRDLFNVRDYGARGDAATDDSVAIASAAAAAATDAAGHRTAVLFFPAGVYRLVAALPTFTAPVSVIGDGHAQSVIFVDPAFSGDVFSWSGVVGNHMDRAQQRHGDGAQIKGIRIVGNRSTTNLQNAFVFYDRAEHVLMQDVDVFYMTGRAFYSGAVQRAALAFLGKSRLDSLRFFNCGSPGVPVVDIGARGSGAATSEVSIDALDLFAPYGTGVVIHGDWAQVHTIRIAKLRIEGLQNGTSRADLLQVGDAALTGDVSDITFEQAELIDPYFGFAAVRFAAPNLSAAPHDVRYQGDIGGGLPNGKGLVIDAGRSLRFDLRGIHTTDVNVAVASSATVAAPIIIDAHGQEARWTRAIDPSSIANVKKPALQPF